MEAHRERFFKMVDKTGSCWLWKGSLDGGYGKFYTGNISFRSHRFSWLLAGNTIPEGHVIRHKCRNRHCVNPEHLETGTHQENALDRVRDGTVANGCKQGKSKLTEEQVRAIRDNPDNKSGYRMAKEYSVSDRTISDIILRKTWKHI